MMIPRCWAALRRCLEGEGFVVFEAKNGRQMQVCLTRQPVSLITLDLFSVPRMALDLARDIGKDRSVPIIMPTGKGDFIDWAVDIEVGPTTTW
jgi:two-component system OmpR family response regulator